MDRLKTIKYIVLFLLITIPMLIANGGLHPDFTLPFCQICPAKPLMPLFEGNIKYFALNLTNYVTIAMSALSILFAAFFIVGMFFKDRFFCIFCPLLALMSVFDKLGLFRLVKNPTSCIGCGNCRRLCPSEIRSVHEEKEKSDMLLPACIECFKCVESCPGEKTLSVKFLKWRVFSSSRKYAQKIMKWSWYGIRKS